LTRYFILSLVSLSLLAPLGAASQEQGRETVYLTADAFLKEVFGNVPKPSVLWLTPEVQAAASKILGHAPAKLRERYWAEGGKTVWILEEIGKEEFITAAFVVGEGRIAQTRVLIYRESRGMEVRYPAFVNQFTGAQLTGGYDLSKPVDGISGATLSVWAMSRMARQALYFDSLSQAK
jgi:FMN-binding domain